MLSRTKSVNSKVGWDQKRTKVFREWMQTLKLAGSKNLLKLVGEWLPSKTGQDWKPPKKMPNDQMSPKVGPQSITR